MANTADQQDKRDKNDQAAQESTYMSQRRALNNAYASLQGRAVANTFSAFTFEEAIDARVELIEGKDSDIHPNELRKIANLQGELTTAVAALKSLPPEMFIKMQPQDSVNTPEDGSVSDDPTDDDGADE